MYAIRFNEVGESWENPNGPQVDAYCVGAGSTEADVQEVVGISPMQTYVPRTKDWHAEPTAGCHA